MWVCCLIGNVVQELLGAAQSGSIIHDLFMWREITIDFVAVVTGLKYLRVNVSAAIFNASSKVMRFLVLR